MNQGIIGAKQPQPADVVRWLGAVQAQEYEPAKWALAWIGKYAPPINSRQIAPSLEVGHRPENGVAAVGS